MTSGIFVEELNGEWATVTDKKDNSSRLNDLNLF